MSCCVGLKTGNSAFAPSFIVAVTVTCTCSPMSISIESMAATTVTCARTANTAVASNMNKNVLFIINFFA